ncbi:CHASE3 domain-containing protein [uncultured Xylophilus sp.]|uniref:CHASE3 domain-containing protein n=1 Tax=uncultured Xylophilus sp. TaxID=296832 RepID=UPI0025DBA47A|nr:CHASE3 domain-containing protein [uncultured Xylophilus sp.]
MRRSSLAKLVFSLPLAILAAVVLIGINEAGYDHSTQALRSIEQAQQARTELNRLVRQMLDAETGQRGYLLTGEETYLEPYNVARADIGATLDTLRKAYALLPEQQAQVTQLAVSVLRKLAEMDLSVRLRAQGNEDAWRFVLLTDVGREQMDAIRTQTDQLLTSTAVASTAAQDQIVRSLQLSRIGIASVALVGLLAFYMYLRQTRALQRAGERQQEALERERDRLGELVRQRTASLAELATHLQRVREDERGLLARELHDELGALLTAAKLDVARIKSRIDPDAPELTARLQHLTETLNSGIALKRRIIEDLRPSSLSNLGLVAALEILAREVGDQSGIAISTRLEPVPLSEELQLTVYRIVQESLTNICKYAQATRAAITIRTSADRVVVTVKDDGVGFDPAGTTPHTHGLHGMRHRVEAAGGTLTVTSAIGSGTTVSAILPHA